MKVAEIFHGQSTRRRTGSDLCGEVYLPDLIMKLQLHVTTPWTNVELAFHESQQDNEKWEPQVIILQVVLYLNS